MGVNAIADDARAMWIGGFALVRAGPGSYSMIDFRETAPAGSNETMYSNNTDRTSFRKMIPVYAASDDSKH